MNLRKWIIKWLKEGDRDQEAELAVPEYNIKYANSIGTVKSMDDIPLRLNFNVMPAAGGVVVTINKYDRQKGHNLETLHVIHDDEDVANNIGQIVSMELLRSQWN